jgi:MFS family permease
MAASNAARRNLALLIAAQVLLQTASIALITISALVAFDLASDRGLATLPVALGMFTSALLMTPASLYMQRRGRRAGFMSGAVAGMASAACALMAVQQRSFGWFLLASALFGAYQACAQFYRFAAAEACAARDRARAISWVVAAGLLSAFTGPGLARVAAADGNGFAQVFAAFALLAALALLVLSRLRLPPMEQPAAGGGRPLRKLVVQPAFLTAVAGSAAGYGVMASTMSATPLAMQLCGFSVAGAASVIQWHMLGMFAPSLVAGRLIGRVGVLPVMCAGAACHVAAMLTAISGQQPWHFHVALMLLGVGWNFLYVGGSTLLAKAWQPGEQARVQASHDLLVFAVASVGTFFSGRVLNAAGWNSVNTFTLPLLVIAVAMIFVYWRAGPRSAAVA